MSNDRPHILIAGGGIGGLTTAIALGRAGFSVEVLERAPELREVGAGITLQPNAIAALRKIGLANAVLAAGHSNNLVAIRQRDGRAISELDTASFWKGEPSVAIHRATLQNLLAGQLAPGQLRLGAEIVGFEEVGESVALKLADGRRAQGDLLIGADGIRSAVRRQLLRDGEPRYAGYFCWRGICPPIAEPPRGMSETWGVGQRFGLVPIDGGRIYWFSVLSGQANGRDLPGEVKANLKRLYAGWHDPIAAVIDATPEAAILRGDILDRPPAKTWGHGRITLLGDAAHPMTPDLGQGACQAVEDAVVLAACLARNPADPTAALRAYEKLRMPRTTAIVNGAARMGKLAQLQEPWLCSLRTFIQKLVPRRTLQREITRLWHFPGTGD